jgi:hypothetical protein
MGIFAHSRTLTRRMRGTLIVAAGIAVLGFGASAWLLVAPASPSQQSPAAAQQPTAGPAAGALPTTGSEVQAPTESGAPSDRLPTRVAARPLVTVPLPPSASAEGEVVPGFPAEAAGPIEHSDVIQTSLTGEGDLVQVTLVGRSDAVPADILAHYAAVWADLGLTASPGATADATTYSDAFSSLTVSAEEAGTGIMYTVFGVLRAG